MPDESILGGASGDFTLRPGGGKPTWFQRMVFGKQGLTGTVSAGLKFDIPGLQEFRTELSKIRVSVQDLNTSFTQLAKGGPKLFAAELAKVNEQLVAMNRNSAAVRGSTGAGGTGTSTAAPRQAGAAWGPPLPPPAPGTGVPNSENPALTGGMGSAAGPAAAAAIAQTISKAVTAGMNAAFERYQKGADTATQNDVYLSRLALSTGRTGRGEMGRLGGMAQRSGHIMLGSSQEISQTMYDLSQQGYVIGGSGLAGQRGAAASDSIAMLQRLSPGMRAPEAASIFTNQAANISAQRTAGAVFGQAAMAYTASGKAKPLQQRFQEVLDVLRNLRQGDKKGQPFTKDELTASQIPGSTMHTYFAVLGWDEAMIGQFFEFALASASYGPGFTGTEQQLEKVRGKSLALSHMETETKQAERDFKFGARQYGTALSQEEVQRRLLDVLERLDSHLAGGYGILGRVPRGWGPTIAKWIGGGGSLGAAVSAVGGSGDPPGLSQLNPDVRSRIGQMMEANPNLHVVSGYRTNLQQRRMYESGNPFVAPPGKSHHGRGAAADLGPPSQYGWIKRNAKRFGLDHAAGMGEPWHVQLSGTMFGIGDIDPAAKAQWSAQMSSYFQGVQMHNVLAEGAAGWTPGGVQPTGGGSTAATDAATGTAQGVPGSGSGVTGGNGALSWDDLAKVAYNAGFRGEALKTMIAIAGGESERNPGAYNPNANTGDKSYGLWQINMLGKLGPARMKEFGLNKEEDLFDPDTNAKAAWILSGGGKNFQPWSVYKSNIHTKYLPQAEQAMKDLGYGDVGVGGGAYGGGSSSSQVSMVHQPVSFNNTFNVTVSGSGPTDVDRLVRQISSKLEIQLQRAQTTRR